MRSGANHHRHNFSEIWHTFCIPIIDMSISATESTGARFPNAKSVDSKKWKAAQDFEAMFIHQMLKSMRSTVPKDEEMSSARRIFTEMLDEQIANTASRSGHFGLAQIIYKELDGKTEAKATGEQVENWVNEASKTFDLNKNLLKAVIRQESGGNSLAVSSKGAKGLMQLMDSTAKDMGVANSYNGRQNVIGGAKYLKQMLVRFNGDEKKALAAYNAGPGTVEQYGGIPPYEETKNYIKNVLQFKEEFSQ